MTCLGGGASEPAGAAAERLLSRRGHLGRLHKGYPLNTSPSLLDQLESTLEGVYDLRVDAAGTHTAAAQKLSRRESAFLFSST